MFVQVLRLSMYDITIRTVYSKTINLHKSLVRHLQTRRITGSVIFQSQGLKVCYCCACAVDYLVGRRVMPGGYVVLYGPVNFVCVPGPT